MMMMLRLLLCASLLQVSMQNILFYPTELNCKSRILIVNDKLQQSTGELFRYN